ncbi:hypothetical protein Tco_0087760 [Tanacetum coccineum]
MKDVEEVDVSYVLVNDWVSLIYRTSLRLSSVLSCMPVLLHQFQSKCKKQTVVANSTAKAEYVAASRCCGQLWSTVKAKTINGEVQLHALVDGKKIIITESSVRRDLQLADEEGMDCLKFYHFDKITLIGVQETHKLKRLYKVGLTARVESFDDEESLGEGASKQGKIDAIDANEEITLVSVHDMKVLMMRSSEFNEEKRLARETAGKEKEANIALIETWDDIQAKIDADHQLAERLQAQEQEELSVEEKATLFQQLERK